MAKAILSFFGGLSILIGLVVLLAGALVGRESGLSLIVTLPTAAGLLIAGAPLLGFARSSRCAAIRCA